MPWLEWTSAEQVRLLHLPPPRRAGPQLILVVLLHSVMREPIHMIIAPSHEGLLPSLRRIMVPDIDRKELKLIIS